MYNEEGHFSSDRAECYVAYRETCFASPVNQLDCEKYGCCYRTDIEPNCYFSDSSGKYLSNIWELFNKNNKMHQKSYFNNILLWDIDFMNTGLMVILIDHWIISQ